MDSERGTRLKLTSADVQEVVDNCQYLWNNQFLLHREGDEVCCICLEKYGVGEMVLVFFPCRHCLHEACAFPDPQGEKCPTCRQEIEMLHSSKMREEGVPFSSDTDSDQEGDGSYAHPRGSTPPFDQSKVVRLPSPTKESSSTQLTECCVCLENFKVCDLVNVFLPCKHFLHECCVAKIFRGPGKKCPYCWQIIESCDLMRMRKEGELISDGEGVHSPYPWPLG